MLLCNITHSRQKDLDLTVILTDRQRKLVHLGDYNTTVGPERKEVSLHEEFSDNIKNCFICTQETAISVSDPCKSLTV
jgi:hypothetical protein